MAEELDDVSRYALTLGFRVRRRTVLVEGTSDVELFEHAAQAELAKSGEDLFGQDLAIVAAGVGDRGGTHGVIRELVGLRGMARTCLMPDGRLRYRFVGLLDNDKAGRRAVSLARELDSSMLEFKDVFRLWPVMPLLGNLDPASLQRTFEKENTAYRGLDWELEDLLPHDFLEEFESQHLGAVMRSPVVNGKMHRDLSPDGKAKLHQFVKQHAIHDDLVGVIAVLKSLRHYLGLK